MWHSRMPLCCALFTSPRQKSFSCSTSWSSWRTASSSTRAQLRILCLISASLGKFRIPGNIIMSEISCQYLDVLRLTAASHLIAVLGPPSFYHQFTVLPSNLTLSAIHTLMLHPPLESAGMSVRWTTTPLTSWCIWVRLRIMRSSYRRECSSSPRRDPDPRQERIVQQQRLLTQVSDCSSRQ